jgi:hypothetical protein
LILGLLQLIEETFQLNSVPVTLSKLIVGSHKPNKTEGCQSNLAIRFSKSSWREFVKKSENMKNKTLVEDMLDGSSNFNSWKSRLQVTLEEDDLLSVIQKTLPETTTDEEKEIRREEDVKARKIIIYSIRDHLLPRIANLKTTYEMYEALKDMFESDNTLRALTLKGQLQSTKMTKGDTVATFFMKI